MKQVTLSSIVISALLAASTAFSASGANANKGRLVAQNTRAVAQVKRADAVEAAKPAEAAVTSEAKNPFNVFGTESAAVRAQNYAEKLCANIPDSEFIAVENKDGTIKPLGQRAEKCLVATASTGLPPCNELYADANKALKDFDLACGESGYQTKECIQAAVVCAQEDQDAVAKDLAEDKTINAAYGTDDPGTKEEIKNKCAKYNRKDYDAQKSEISTKLREARKDLEAVQKERAKAAQEYSTDKRKQVEKQSRIQEQMSKLIDSNQKEAQERAQDMSKSIIETEKEQASARVQNIKAQGAIARIQGLRANDLSKLTDAMISTNCMAKMDLLLKQWALEGKQTVHGAAALFQSNTEKKRRIQDEHRACIEQLTSTRKQLRKQYAAEVQEVKETIKGNDKQAAALEEQKTRLAADYQAFLARQGASTQEAYVRANAELTALGQENTEIEQIRQARSNEALQDIYAAQQRITDLSNAMANMGTPPRAGATKIPSEAVTHVKTFLRNYRAMAASESCKGLVPVFTAKAASSLQAMKDFDAGKTSDSSGTTPAKATPGSK